MKQRRIETLKANGFSSEIHSRDLKYSPVYNLNRDILDPYFKSIHSFAKWMGIHYPDGEFRLLGVIKVREQQLNTK